MKVVLRAAAEGKDPAAYASELVEHAVTKPTIDEILAPVRDEFAKARMTEAQIMQFGRKLLRKYGRRRRPRRDEPTRRLIEADARYLVTWERRVLGLRRGRTPEAKELRRLAPTLEIVRPDALVTLLREEAE